jgi:phage baseplate assembly protein W
MAEGLTIALPLSLGNEDGPYSTLKDMESLAEQHLKMIVLTNPGERVFDSQFGAGVRNYLFEQGTPSLSSEIRNKIKDQVDKYSPFIDILKINAKMEPNTGLLSLEIKYSVPDAGIVSDLTIPIS